jgi:hypothetical protein
MGLFASKDKLVNDLTKNLVLSIQETDEVRISHPGAYSDDLSHISRRKGEMEAV